MDGWAEQENASTEFNWSVSEIDGDQVIKCDAAHTGSPQGWSNLFFNTSLEIDDYVTECWIKSGSNNVTANLRHGIGYEWELVAHRLDAPSAAFFRIDYPGGRADSEQYSNYNASEWHEYCLVINGSYIELIVDDISRTSGSNLAYDPGYIGMWCRLYGQPWGSYYKNVSSWFV